MLEGYCRQNETLLVSLIRAKSIIIEHMDSLTNHLQSRPSRACCTTNQDYVDPQDERAWPFRYTHRSFRPVFYVVHRQVFCSLSGESYIDLI